MTEAIRSERQQWNYMASEVFQSRYLVAANYLRNCSHILEVGGCSTPITNYLRGEHESVTVVDPLVEPLHAETLNDRPCTVRHIPVKVQDYGPTGRENGFAALGMPLLPLEPVLGIMRRCDVSVVEFPPAFLQSCLMFQAVLASGHFEVADRIVFDLSKNDVRSLSDSTMAVRHLFVLKKKNTDGMNPRLAKWLQVSADYVREARKHERKRAIRAKSATLLKEYFHSGYTRLKQMRDARRARSQEGALL
jgi:hypothetical protein